MKGRTWKSGLLILAAITLALVTLQLPSTEQAENADLSNMPAATWLERFDLPSSKAPMVWENDVVWDRRIDAAFYGFGHLTLNTNRLWLYTHDADVLYVPAPFHRPPKRCGPKMIFDETVGLNYVFGGATHPGLDHGYGQINDTGTGLVGDINVTLGVWGFDGVAEQWYNFRPLTPWPKAPNEYRTIGFDMTMTFAADYGLMFIMHSNITPEAIWGYHGYSNRWIEFPTQGEVPTHRFSSPLAYDARNHKLIKVGGLDSYFGKDALESSETWVFDPGTNAWQQLVLSSELPTHVMTNDKSSPDFNGGGTMAINYDEQAGEFVVVSADGTQMSALNLDRDSGWRTETILPGPGVGGTLGGDFAYDPTGNVHLLSAGYVKEADERVNRLYVYKHGLDNGLPTRPEDLTAVTTSNQVRLDWRALPMSVSGYRVYRAAWDTRPGPFVPIAETTQTTYTDTPLMTEGKEYSYLVVAYIDEVEGMPSLPAYTYPLRPPSLVASVEAFDSVALAWKPSAASDVVGYHVYRAAGPLPERNGFVRLTSAPLSSAGFRDQGIDLSDGLIQHYAVSAVNNLGRESGFSPIAHTVPDSPGGPWLDVSAHRMHWLSPANQHIIGYQVYDNGFKDHSIDPLPEQVTSGPIAETFFDLPHGLCGAFTVAAVNILGQRGFGSDFVPVDGAKPDGSYCPAKSYYDYDGRDQPVQLDPLWGQLVGPSACSDGSCPTCSDGIQNGSETGVDCGGPDCDPCEGGPFIIWPGAERAPLNRYFVRKFCFGITGIWHYAIAEAGSVGPNLGWSPEVLDYSSTRQNDDFSTSTRSSVYMTELTCSDTGQTYDLTQSW